MLGNSRLLIIVISVLSAVALICMGASAVEPVEGVYREGGAVKFPPQANEQFKGFAFTSSYRYDSVTGSTAVNSGLPTSADTAFMVCYVFLYSPPLGAGSTISLSFDKDVPLYINPPSSGTDWSLVVDGVTYPLHRYGDQISFSFGSYSMTDWTLVSPTFEVSSLFGAVLAVGNILVSFVMSSWVVLVPVVAFVCILGFGFIRRLVKGV